MCFLSTGSGKAGVSNRAIDNPLNLVNGDASEGVSSMPVPHTSKSESIVSELYQHPCHDVTFPA